MRAVQRSIAAGLMAVFGMGCLTGPSEFSDPAVPIQVKVGDEFVIVLESNASTGFAWRLASATDERVVRFVRSRYDGPSSSGTVGAAGKEYWTFAAAGAGTSVIRLEYVRSFETTPATTTAAFTVEVR